MPSSYILMTVFGSVGSCRVSPSNTQDVTTLCELKRSGNGVCPMSQMHEPAMIGQSGPLPCTPCHLT